MTKREEIEGALLSGMTPQQLFDAGYNPGSIGFCVSRLSTAKLVKRPKGFIGWLGRAQRLSILRRDSYTCQKCGAHGNDVELQIHHKDHNKRNNRRSNRIAWCKRCNFEEGQEYARGRVLAKAESRESKRKEAIGNTVQVDRSNTSLQDLQKTAKGVTSFMKDLVDGMKYTGLDT